MNESRRTQHLTDIKQVLSTSSGRRVLLSYLNAAGVFETSFSREPLIMAFAEGRRDIGLRMVADILEAAPEKYMTLMQILQEQRAKEQEADEHGRNRRDHADICDY